MPRRTIPRRRARRIIRLYQIGAPISGNPGGQLTTPRILASTCNIVLTGIQSSTPVGPELQLLGQGINADCILELELYIRADNTHPTDTSTLQLFLADAALNEAPILAFAIPPMTLEITHLMVAVQLQPANFQVVFIDELTNDAATVAPDLNYDASLNAQPLTNLQILASIDFAGTTFFIDTVKAVLYPPVN